MSAELIAELAAVVDTLTEAKESGKETRKQARILKEAAEVLTSLAITPEETSVAENIGAMAEVLAQSAGGKTDTTNKLANRVKGLAMAEILGDEDQIKAEAMVEAYAKLGGGGGGGGSRGDGPRVTAPDFDFPIEARYNGVKVTCQGSKDGLVWNSLRWECKKYEKKVLGNEDLTDAEAWRKAKAAFAEGQTEVDAGLFHLARV